MPSRNVFPMRFMLAVMGMRFKSCRCNLLLFFRCGVVSKASSAMRIGRSFCSVHVFGIEEVLK